VGGPRVLDTTADAYLDAGVRMMSGALRHPLVVALLSGVVQLAIAAFIAWKLSERWQRWRQHREFKHQLLVRFAEESAQAFDLAAALLVGRDREDPNQRREQMRELVQRQGHLTGMVEEARVTFSDSKIGDTILFMKRTISSLLKMAVWKEPVPSERYEPVQGHALRLRDLVLARMAVEMGLLRDGQARIAERPSEGQGSVDQCEHARVKPRVRAARSRPAP
jgi:hypothetical protein